LKQTNVTETPNVDSTKHKKFNMFSNELLASSDLLIGFQQDEEPQMDFVVVPPIKLMIENESMKIYYSLIMLSLFNVDNIFSIIIC
jgi:hypothetical protein